MMSGMPTLVRAVADERDCLLAFLAEQRAALRRAVHGLTDEQARAKPSVSGLCLAGLVKHVARAERIWIGTFTGATTRGDDQDGGFDLADGDTLASLLARYRAVVEHTASVVVGLGDLGQPVPISYLNSLMPPGLVRSARWVLCHVIEETARHAGHADIVRESLDGATAFKLVAASGTPSFT